MKTKRFHTRILASVVALVMSLGTLTPALASEKMDAPPPEEMQDMNILSDLSIEQEPYIDTNIIYLSADGSDDASGSKTDPKATLAEAYSAIPEDGTIIVLGEVTLDEPVNFDIDKQFTIAGESGAALTYTSTDNINSASGILAVLAGRVTLRDLTVEMPDNRGTNGRPLYVGPDGTVALTEGAVIANGYLAYGGGNVFVDGGTLEMEEGAVIRDACIANNTNCYGGGVLVAGGGTFRMGGGEIVDNTIHTTQGFDSYGGGVAVMAGSTFKFIGGLIRGNSVDTNGGGVYMEPRGAVWLRGELEVSGNEAGGMEDNIFLPDIDTHFELTGAVHGKVGVTCGEAAYGVVVGTPNDYSILTAQPVKTRLTRHLSTRTTIPYSPLTRATSFLGTSLCRWAAWSWAKISTTTTRTPGPSISPVMR